MTTSGGSYGGPSLVRARSPEFARNAGCLATRTSRDPGSRTGSTPALVRTISIDRSKCSTGQKGTTSRVCPLPPPFAPPWCRVCCRPDGSSAPPPRPARCILSAPGTRTTTVQRVGVQSELQRPLSCLVSKICRFEAKRGVGARRRGRRSFRARAGAPGTACFPRLSALLPVQVTYRRIPRTSPRPSCKSVAVLGLFCVRPILRRPGCSSIVHFDRPARERAYATDRPHSPF